MEITPSSKMKQKLERHLLITCSNSSAIKSTPREIETALMQMLAPWIKEIICYKRSVGEMLIYHLTFHMQSDAQRAVLDTFINGVRQFNQIETCKDVLVLVPDLAREIEHSKEVFDYIPDINKVIFGSTELLNDYLIDQCNQPSLSDSAFDQLVAECEDKRLGNISMGIALAYDEHREHYMVLEFTNVKTSFSYFRGFNNIVQRLRLMKDPLVSVYRNRGSYLMLIEWNPSTPVNKLENYMGGCLSMLHSLTTSYVVKTGTEFHKVLITRDQLADKLADSTDCEVIYPNHDLEELSANGDDDQCDDSIFEPGNLTMHQSSMSYSTRSSNQNKTKMLAFLVHPHLDYKECQRLQNELTKSSSDIGGIRVYKSNIKDVQGLFIDAASMCEGFSRQYFVEKKGKGASIMKGYNVSLKKYKSDQAFFEQHRPNATYFGSTVDLTRYQSRLAGDDKLQSFGDEGSQLQQLYTEYHGKLLQGINITPIAFRKQHQDNSRKHLLINKNDNLFQHCYNEYKADKLISIPIISPIETLRQYCDQNPLVQDEKRLTPEFLARYNLLEAVDAISRCVIIRDDPKQGGVLLHGVPNTGKTSLMRYMNGILHAVWNLPQKSSFDSLQPTLAAHPQVLLLDEARIDKMLKDIETFKVLLGRGGMEINCKHIAPIWMYQQSSVIIAVNELDLSKLGSKDRAAIESRLYIVQLTHQFPPRAGLPFSERELALYLVEQFDQYQQGFQIPQKFPSDMLQQAPTEKKRFLGKRTKNNSYKLEERTRKEIQYGTQAVLPLHESFVESEEEEKTVLIDNKISLKKRAKNNSHKLEEKTFNDIAYGIQAVLLVQESSDESEEEKTVIIEKDEVAQQLIQRRKEHIEKLDKYYNGCFPSTMLMQLYGYDLNRREFSYSILKDNKEIMCRYKTLQKDRIEFRREFRRELPFNVTNGAIYTTPINCKKEDRKQLVVQDAELNFDVDMNAYDSHRNCCQGANVCSQCWVFITDVVRFLHTLLTEDFGFYKILWTFSGRRGIHCRVFDDQAREFDSVHRQAVLMYCKEKALNEGVLLFLDEPVTTDPKHLIKVPFTIHPESEKLIVPFDPADVDSFDLDMVPTLDDILRDKDVIEPYFQVLQNFMTLLCDRRQQLYTISNGHKWLKETLGDSFIQSQKTLGSIYQKGGDNESGAQNNQQKKSTQVNI